MYLNCTILTLKRLGTLSKLANFLKKVPRPLPVVGQTWFNINNKAINY